MWKLFLMTFFIIVSTYSFAEWVVIEKNKNEGITRYVDISTIKKNKNKVRMVDLIDYKIKRKALDDKFLSIKIVQEYDCNNARKRILTFNTYNGNMGKGGVIYRDTSPNEWTIIPSFNSTRFNLWEIACNK
ncbi:MAG: hypothetical protein CMH70_09300 [Nitrosomonadaceae bacterium]|nr:hypothetical protein [Nitrosomonadaceae bacterium]|tara:strand:+ start:545 stop:937 length:393 start_codon:yes stop_codon:yes gene_type:complete